jgi:hypothetical protein
MACPFAGQSHTWLGSRPQDVLLLSEYPPRRSIEIAESIGLDAPSQNAPQQI